MTSDWVRRGSPRAPRLLAELQRRLQHRDIRSREVREKVRRLSSVLGCIVTSAMVCVVANGSAYATGDANRQACSSSTEGSGGFRQYLPDCRAYELISPQYKGGSQVQLLLQAIASDGSRLLGTSYGGFGGIENNEQGQPTFGAGIYEMSRGGEGWFAEPLQPSAIDVSHSSYVAASTDLSRTLWELIEAPQPATTESPPEKELLNSATRYSLAVRVHKAGEEPTFEPVGPENPTTETRDERDFSFQGASADLSHIIFGIEAKANAIWPGDTTEQGEGYESLYEYVGLDNVEPVLVGVGNVGALKGSPHINEDASLLSKCGTSLGSPGGSKYDAVSSSGATIFFTAHACFGAPVVNTLYARTNDEVTASLSEPDRPISPEQGNGTGQHECDATCEAAEPQEATFEGASEDGTVAFFLTKQSLLNEDEAGEGSGPDLYEARLEGGRLSKLIQVSHDPNVGEEARVQGVVRISSDGARVYFVAEGALSGKNGEGTSPVDGKDNLYVYDAKSDTVKFVAALAPSDEQDWKLEDNRRTAQTTRDGRFLAFFSTEDLTGQEDTSTVSQLFEYDVDAQRLARVSIGQRSREGYFCPVTKRLESGFNCNGNTADVNLVPVLPLPSYQNSDIPTEATSTLAVTDDGRVFFMSRDALTPEAVEGSKNIYEFVNENVYMIAIGENPESEFAAFQESFNEHDRLVSTDTSGRDLFFGSVGRLVSQDVDSQSDVYDARVEGGFPDVAAGSECEGQSCRGAGSVEPQMLLGAPSALIPGEVLPGVADVTGRPRKTSGRARLRHALASCRRRHGKKRHTCETKVRMRYRTASKSQKTNREGK
jgi:hypothetical protein